MTKEEYAEILYQALIERYPINLDLLTPLTRSNIEDRMSYNHFFKVSNVLRDIGPRIDMQEMIDIAWKRYEIFKIMNM